MKFSGLVIAGGKSTRMGTNKALLFYNGERLIDRAIGVLVPLVDEIMVSSNITIDGLAVPQFTDDVKDIGPLGGLYSGLKRISNSWAFVIPCDVPLISSSVLKLLALQNENYDAVICKLPEGSVEPLVGLYSKHITGAIQQQISNNNYKMKDLLERIKVKYVIIDDDQIFKNLNTPNDWL